MKILKERIKNLDNKIINPYKELIKSYSIADSFNEVPLKEKVIIEIGSGSGNFLNQLAKQSEDKTFIGLELRYKRIVCSAQKSRDLNLSNIFWMKRMLKRLMRYSQIILSMKYIYSFQILGQRRSKIDSFKRIS